MSFYKYLISKIKECRDNENCDDCCFYEKIDRVCPFGNMMMSDIKSAHDMYKCEKGDRKNER